MKIRLKEIPQEGRAYQFDRESAELNDILNDLIGTQDFKVDLFIKPIGNAFEMRGRVETKLTEVCSSCGWDFALPIQRAVNEILFEDQESDRKSHSVHGNNSVDFLGEGPSMTPYRGDVFDAGAYVHEVIALAEPFYPMCGENGSCLRSDEVREIRDRLENEFAVADEGQSENPFSVLKGLNLSKKTQ